MHASPRRNVIHDRVVFPNVLEVVIMAVEVVGPVLLEQRLEVHDEPGGWAVPPDAVDGVVGANPEVVSGGGSNPRLQPRCDISHFTRNPSQAH